MKKVENGMFVSVDYKGTLKNGDVFDSSHRRQPLEAKMGEGHLISGFENELIGMSLHEKKTFTLEPEEAYGQRNENLRQNFPRADVPPEMDPQVGLTVSLYSQEGKQISAQIVYLDGEKVTVDMNHPLAGKNIDF